MKEITNKNEIYTFSIETALVVLIFSIGIIILIIGLIIDITSPHIKAPLQPSIKQYASNIQQANNKYNHIINNKIENSTNNTQIESLDNKPIKNTLTKLDSNYSRNSEHVYYGQQEQGNSLLNLDKDKIKIIGEYITDGKRLYHRHQEIQLGDSNIDLSNLQNAGKTYLRDNTNVYASVYTYNVRSKITTYRIEKLNLDVNNLEFFLDGEWEYIKDNDKVYYLRGDLKMVTTLEGKYQNKTKQWQWDSYQMTNTGLIDFIKSASSVYVKEIKKINDYYKTDGKKLYYNFSDKEVQLGDSNIDLNSLESIGQYYIRDKNSIYSTEWIYQGGWYSLKKLDLDNKYIQFLSGEYEYINYDKNKKIYYYESIKDQKKIYYKREPITLYIISSISEVPYLPEKITSMSGVPYKESDKKRRFKISQNGDDTNGLLVNFTDKTIIDFISTVSSVKKK